MSLFKKAACFSDIHYGLRHNSRQHNDDCEEFLKWFIAEAKKRDCETCIFLGDFHHHRASINVSTLNYSMTAMNLLDSNFDQVFMIVGNHDLFYREKREIHSLVISDRFPNITLVEEQLIKDDVALVPWLVEDEWKSVPKIKSKYLFGHFEIPGFNMNAHVKMPDHGQINRRHFKNQDYVFSGHFHKRQESDNIVYIGNPFGHNYADSWDFNRGAMFIEWDKTPELVNYEDGPKFISCYLSELLENTEDYLQSKMSIRVTLDTNLTYEEANFIKELLIKNYEVRDLKFIYDTADDLEQEFEGEIEFQSIDQIVLEQLGNIDSDTFEISKLIKIYNGL